MIQSVRSYRSRRADFNPVQPSNQRPTQTLQQRRVNRARNNSEFPIEEIERMQKASSKRESDLQSWFAKNKTDFEEIIKNLDDIEDVPINNDDEDKDNFDLRKTSEKVQENFIKSLGTILKNKSLVTKTHSFQQKMHAKDRHSHGLIDNFEKKIATHPALVDQPIEVERPEPFSESQENRNDDQETNQNPKPNDLEAQSNVLNKLVDDFKKDIIKAHENLEAQEDAIQQKDLKDFYNGRDFISDRKTTNDYIHKFFEKNASESRGNDDDDEMEIEQNQDNRIVNKCPLSLKPFENPVVILRCKRVCVFERSALESYFENRGGGHYHHYGQTNVICPTTGCGTQFSRDDIHGDRYLTNALKKYFKNE